MVLNSINQWQFDVVVPKANGSNWLTYGMTLHIAMTSTNYRSFVSGSVLNYFIVSWGHELTGFTISYSSTANINQDYHVKWIVIGY